MSRNIPGLNRKDACEKQLILPSLEEQKRIAAILDQADELRLLRQRAIERLNELGQAIFYEMFGDPTTNNKSLNKKDLIDVTIGKNGIKAGPFGSALKKEDYTEKGYRVYGQEQVISGSFNIGNYYISAKKFSDLKSCAVMPGDILVSLVGSYGRNLIVPEGIEPGIINPRLLKISPNLEVMLPTFISAFLAYPSVQSELKSLSHGGTMGILNAGILKKLKIIIPPLNSQKEFENKLKEISALKTHFEYQNKIIEFLYSSLQYYAFQGQL